MAATRSLPAVQAFEAFLREWCRYLPEILPVVRALEAAYITGDEGGETWQDRITDLREGCRLALGRVAADNRLAPGWAVDSAADWAWARIQPSTWAHLVGMRGWDPGTYTERTISSLLAELISDYAPPRPRGYALSWPGGWGVVAVRRWYGDEPGPDREVPTATFIGGVARKP